MKTRTTQVTVGPKGEAIFHESMTTITIDDEAAGEFLTIKQCNDITRGEIRISPEEWPEIRDAIDRMINEIEQANQ